MRRRHLQETEEPSHDSFLDIVANIVGILIILVMVTGARAKNWPAEAVDEQPAAEALAALEQDQSLEISLRRNMATLKDQLRQLETEALAQHQVRTRRATVVAVAEREIESRRQGLDAESRQALRLRQQLSQAQAELENLRHERQVALATVPEAILVQSYPTPLSHTVDDREIHFQLRAGRVVFIPLERLLKRFKQDAQRKVYKLRTSPELSGTVGPEGGFRLRYTLVRRDLSPEMQINSGTTGYAQLSRWTLIPVAGLLGEPVDEALAAASRFREVLAAHSPETTTVTIWTYGDSFAEFRRLKKELFGMGFATAGRPLPDGAPIGGSPHGTKSAAE